MSAVIALIDYGAGNLTSVRKALAAAGGRVVTPAAPGGLASAQGVVVPGVGHFAATAALDPEWREAIGHAAERGVPLLGICLGLQWLFDGSHEATGVRGLGAIHGACTRLPPGRKVPHVGWNTLDRHQPSRLLTGVPSGSYVYFTHSYAAPVTAECVATTSYGTAFAAVVESANVFGVQFHPEKSGSVGLRLLANFVALARDDDRIDVDAG